MKVLVVEPGRKPRVEKIDGTLESMREIVGGRIQAMYPSKDVALVFNHDPHAQHLPQNRGVRDDDGTFIDIVRGTFSLCGAPEDGNYFISLTEEQIQRYTKIFALPEVFPGLGGRTIILPCGEERTYYESASIHTQSERHGT